METTFFTKNDTIHAEGLAIGTDMYETKLNNNAIVYGTPGAGKTEGHVKPNILQRNSSYVVTDPKGSLLGDVGNALEDAGYEVWSLNLANPDESSVSYNPFCFARTSEDIRAIAHSIVYSDGDRNRDDPFWDNSAEILMMALANLLVEEQERGGKPASIPLMLDAINDYFYASKGTISAPNRLAERFEQIRTGLVYSGCSRYVQKDPSPNSQACKLWTEFKTIAEVDTTMRCIMMSAISHLSALCTEGVSRIISGNGQIDFEALGTRKCALFLVVSDTDRSLDPLVSIFYSQMFRELCRHADSEACEPAHRLPVPVRVILDDFANIGVVKDFDSIIAAVRSRDIWITVICQSVGQLASKYGEAATTIAECCDTALYFGSNSMATMRELSERADVPISKIQSMPLGKLYAFVRGRAPILANRFDVRKHPAYRLTASGSDRAPYKPAHPAIQRMLFADKITTGKGQLLDIA